jgi:septal ring factor EnvC (AmiA/AmiB activator)
MYDKTAIDNMFARVQGQLDPIVEWMGSTTEALKQVQATLESGDQVHGAAAKMLEALATQAAELAADIRGLDQTNDGIRSDLGRISKRIRELEQAQDADRRQHARSLALFHAQFVEHVGEGDNSL